MSIPRFAAISALLAAVLLAGVSAGGRKQWFDIPSFSVQTAIFVALSTVILYAVLIKRSRSQLFTQVYLLSTVIKLFFYASFILVVVFADRAGATANAVFFLAAYAAFTVLEIWILFRSVNR